MKKKLNEIKPLNYNEMENILSKKWIKNRNNENYFIKTIPFAEGSYQYNKILNKGENNT